VGLQNWINEARAHWKEFLPNRYREFEEAGVLDEALQEAAERTAFEMGQFQRAGLTWDEAWERTRQEYIFLPPEPKEKAKLDREPSPNVTAQMFNEIARINSEILQMDNDDGMDGG
jgi:hypothetical protein